AVTPEVARRYARCVGVLREVVEADLPVFYEHERDREAAAMAVFPSRERDAFMAHWAKTLANDSALTWTVVSDGAVAGNIGCWEDDGRRLVGNSRLRNTQPTISPTSTPHHNCAKRASRVTNPASAVLSFTRYWSVPVI